MCDDQLISLVTDFRSGVLDCIRYGGDASGMCLALSAPLQAYLFGCGIQTALEEGINHFYLVLPDGRILDPTADQYGYAPVYLGPRLPIHNKPCHDISILTRPEGRVLLATGA